MRVTMRDVADRSEVSVMTVSRVLNGQPGVSAATVKAVQEAVESVGYRKNELARSLRPGQKSRMIALVIGDISNPFYGILAQAIETYARLAGYAVVIYSTNEDPDLERRGVNDLLARQVDGLILVTCDTDHQYLRSDLKAGTALVFVDRPAGDLACDTVLTNDRAGANAATTTLIDRGHTRIGFVGHYEHIYTAVERRSGFEEAVRVHGLSADRCVMGIHTRQEAEAAVDKWLSADPAPTAIVASNNVIAAGAAVVNERRGHPVEIAAFDVLADSAKFITVGCDVAKIGRRAAELLFEQIAGPPRDPTTEIIEVDVSDSRSNA